MSIIENHYLNNASENKNYKVELENKELIKVLNNLYDIRESIDDYTECAIRTLEEKNLISSDADYDIIKRYIEDLFGYKTPTQLLELLRNYYGTESSIEIIENELRITVNTPDPMKYMKENINILKEIKKYYLQNSELDIVIIDINNADVNDTFPNPLLRFVYEINIKNGQMKKIYYRKHGNPDIKEESIRIV